ncbi:GAF domain-containing protein [Botrimarina hoheduenensis]|uniref:Transcriptional regulatory protein EmbR n=1 Tax=Botrimarina hoheduenensis TaxID=2528000 RepID=A0A5C5WEA5_9BACT|nr:GAF domain-containing protein [Botrimarina hoheduenensis]TWT48807.1 Transcriptional regulatory protein EmbR [Botrimarina hoheduenensis]
MASLRLIKGVQPGKDFPLTAKVSVIGRNSDCEVSLDVAAVSRRHAALHAEPEGHYAEDLGSRNGTYVNGERIVGKKQLRSGDRIVVCDQEFEFFGPAPSLLGGSGPPAKSTLVQMIAEDDGPASTTNVMATIDLSGAATGSGATWSLSARPEVKLAALVEISKGLGRALSIDDVLPKILDSLFKIFTQADRAFIVMRPEPDAPLVPVASKTRRGEGDETIRLSRTIVEEAMTGKKAILSADATSDERFGMAESIADFQIRSMMCVPLISAEDEALGVIQVDTLNQGSRFTDDDLEVLAAVASQAAIAVDNAQMYDQMIAQRALQRDLELAARMQRALLPQPPPPPPGTVSLIITSPHGKLAATTMITSICPVAVLLSSWATSRAKGWPRRSSWPSSRATSASRSRPSRT